MGLGTEHDCDANLLKDDVRGRAAANAISATTRMKSPASSPRTRSPLRAARLWTSSLLTFSFTTGGYALLSAAPASPPPALGGYNLTYIRPQAHPGPPSLRIEYKAPVVASWNAGNVGGCCVLPARRMASTAVILPGGARPGNSTPPWRAGSGREKSTAAGRNATDGASPRWHVPFVQRCIWTPTARLFLFSALPQVKILHGLPGTAPARQTADFALAERRFA